MRNLLRDLFSGSNRPVSLSFISLPLVAPLFLLGISIAALAIAWACLIAITATEFVFDAPPDDNQSDPFEVARHF